MKGTYRSSCSQTGQPWHCKKHEKLSQTWKKAASGHKQGQNTGHREEHSNRSKVGRKQLRVQNAGQGIGMGSTGMEMLRLWGTWNCTREVTLDKLRAALTQQPRKEHLWQQYRNRHFWLRSDQVAHVFSSRVRAMSHTSAGTHCPERLSLQTRFPRKPCAAAWPHS